MRTLIFAVIMILSSAVLAEDYNPYPNYNGPYNAPVCQTTCYNNGNIMNCQQICM